MGLGELNEKIVSDPAGTKAVGEALAKLGKEGRSAQDAVNALADNELADAIGQFLVAVAENLGA